MQGVVGTTRGQGRGGAGPGEAPRLAAAWRALLRQHELGADGHCVACNRGRWTTRSVSARTPMAGSSSAHHNPAPADHNSVHRGPAGCDFGSCGPISRDPADRGSGDRDPAGCDFGDHGRVEGASGDYGSGDYGSGNCGLGNCGRVGCAPGDFDSVDRGLAGCALGDHGSGRSGWPDWFGWWPARRRSGLCTVWQVAVAYFIRRLPNGER